ncbi:MAG: Holliday junction branch migration protein RuvA [Sandaracinaceae bacterium]|nr:Holliday junction branch migration protein RuvA [Sandaracinaceae bacterium]
MIGRLTGIVIERGLDGACIVDVNGVGYEVLVPVGALGRVAEAPNPATLFIHTHAREDALVLFGFASLEDRVAFRALLSVSTIGPKTALAIIGSLDAQTLARAIALSDRTAFKGIPGVAKKTIERVLLDLKDKLPVVALTNGAAAAARKAVKPADDPLVFVANTLISMGYKPGEADRAVAAVSENAEGKAVETLLREALAMLS